MLNIENMMQTLSQERPTGTKINQELCDYLTQQFQKDGYVTSSLPFACLTWEKGHSSGSIAGFAFPVEAAPFSPPYEGTAPVVVIHALGDLTTQNCAGKIVVLQGEIAGEPVQAKDYPFYFPDNHRAIIDAVEASGCAAILAVTGQHPMCGMNPYPLFVDGLFPNAYISEQMWEQLSRCNPETMTLIIRSGKNTAASRQPVGTKQGKRARGRIIVCAHMDSQYNTPAALDNAAGVAMMMELANLLKEHRLPDTIQFVPFNSEEHIYPLAELAYLDRLEEEKAEITLVINIDSPCHAGSLISVATHNFSGEMTRGLEQTLTGRSSLLQGEPWYAGDHMPFAVKGIPCLTVASSDFYSGGLSGTHTPNDTPDTVDLVQIRDGAAFLCEYILSQVSQKH